MPVCSYLVVPRPGATEALADELDALAECDVRRAENRDLLLLVTETPDPAADRALRDRIEGMEGIGAMVLTFGDIDPETDEADPVRSGRKGGKGRRRSGSLPVLDPAGIPEVLSGSTDS